MRIALALAVALSLVSASVADQAEASIRKPTQIAAQDLGSALKSLAENRGLAMVYRAEVVSKLNTGGASGELTTDEALRALLRGTQLTYKFLDEKTVTILPVATGPAVKSKESKEGVAGKDKEAQNDSGFSGRIRVAEVGAAAYEVTGAAADEVRGAGEEKETSLEELVVTGTHIRGLPERASPVAIYTAQEIERSGVATVQDFIAKLPQNFSGNISESANYSVIGSNADNRASGATVNLHGLGANATLVLLNGRRMAPSGQSGNFVDISQIPMSAIDRIEVLADGASAIYGSDAVAGIVNFILRSDFDGAETTARAGSVTKGSMSEYRVDHTMGHAWSNGSGLASVEYYNRGNLGAEDRSFASQAVLPNDLLPEQKRVSVLLSGQQRVGDSLKLFADVLHTDRSSHQVYNTGSATTTDADIKQSQVNAGGSWAFSKWLAQVDTSFSRDAIDQSYVGADFVSPGNFSTDGKTVAVDLRADGPVFTLPAGSVKLALGAGYRTEKYASRFVEDGVPIGINYAADRSVRSAYGELFIPLFGNSSRRDGWGIDLTVAGRYEHYSDFGGTFNPKYSLRWSTASGWNVHASYGKSFVAPTFSEMTAPPTALLFNTVDPTSPSGSAVLLYHDGGNPHLDPEKSQSWSAGLGFAPASLPGLSLKADYFNIDYRDKIEAPSADPATILLDEPVWQSLINRAPTQAEISALTAPPVPFYNITQYPGYGPLRSLSETQVIYDARYNNIGVTRVSGVDFSAAYSVENRLGNLELGLSGTYLDQLQKKLTPTSIGVEFANTIFNPADLRMRASASLTRGKFGASLNLNYTGGYTDNQAPVDTPVSSWTTVDLQLRHTADETDTGFLRGVTVVLSVQNLLDKDPPFIQGYGLYSPSNFGYDPTNANPLGRFVSLQVGKRW